MKNILCKFVIMVFLACPGVTNAMIQIAFQTDFGGNAILDHLGAPLASDSLFLVYWSSDNIQGFNDIDPFAPVGGDVFLGGLSTHESGPALPGDIMGNSSVNFFTNSVGGTPGFVYIAAFEMPYASYTGTGSVSVGTYYGLGTNIGPSLTENFAVAPLPTPDDYGVLISPDSGGLGIQTMNQIVPEPGTWALMCLGVATIVSRCRRKKS